MIGNVKTCTSTRIPVGCDEVPQVNPTGRTGIESGTLTSSFKSLMIEQSREQAGECVDGPKLYYGHEFAGTQSLFPGVRLRISCNEHDGRTEFASNCSAGEGLSGEISESMLNFIPGQDDFSILNTLAL